MSHAHTEEDSKLVELSRLAGGLAHEIRNPLSTVNLNLQLLEEDLASSHCDQDAIRRCRRRLDRLRNEVNRLSDVLDDFLRFARMPAPVPEPHDVNDLVSDVISFAQPEARRRDVTILSGLGSLPPCPVDPDLLKQALLNLLINAQQAMPSGGKIMVRTWADDDGVKISVADTGHGMDAQLIQRIFDPYVSTKPQGTGLGLPTVKRIIKEHAGRIEVHSELNKGTSFTLALPTAPSGATDQQPATRDTAHDHSE